MNKRPNKHVLATQDSNPIYPALSDQIVLAPFDPFNVGVEIGQLLALSAILIVMGYWRRTASFWRHAYTANVAMMSAGFLLMGYQLTGLIVSS